MSKCEDLANDLSDAWIKHDFEQTTYAGFLMCLASNRVERTAERLGPYLKAFNEAKRVLWAVLWEAYREGCTVKYPGKAPQASYNPDKICDARCWGAHGHTCVCSCGSAFHGLGKNAVLTFMAQYDKVKA